MRRADNLTTCMCRFVLKSGSPNLLEPSWPFQACNGIALPLRSYILRFAKELSQSLFDWSRLLKLIESKQYFLFDSLIHDSLDD